MESPRVPCLYCGSTDEPKTREHLLQAGLGGALTLTDDVCGKCNTDVFSSLDDAFIHAVHTLFCADHPDVPKNRMFFQAGHHMERDERSGVWVSLRLDNKFGPTVFDQFVLLPENQIHVTMDPLRDGDPKERFEQMLTELRDGATAKLAKKILVADPPVETAIIRSGRGRFLIRAASDEAATELVDRIRSGGYPKMIETQGEWQQSVTQQPQVRVNVSLKYEAIQRAIAKTALNFACKTLGPEAVRRPCFDEVRNYALTGSEDDSSPVQIISPASEQAQSDLVDVICKPDHHVITLVATDVAVGVELFLYQKPIATVKLAMPYAGEHATVLGVFNYKTKRAKVAPHSALCFEV